MARQYSYEDCRAIARNMSLEQVTTLAVIHRGIVNDLPDNDPDKQNQVNFAQALEDQLAEFMDEIEGGVA